MNISPVASGSVTTRSTSRAGRANDADGYSVTHTHVVTTVTTTLEDA